MYKVPKMLIDNTPETGYFGYTEIEISGLDIGERRFKFFAAQDSVNIMRTTDNSISEVIPEPTPEPES